MRILHPASASSEEPAHKEGQKTEERRESAGGESQTSAQFPVAVACGWFQIPFYGYSKQLKMQLEN